MASNYSVYNGSYNTTVLQIARDILEDYRGDYYFFKYGQNDYLLICTDSWDQDTLTGTDCDIYDIRYTTYTAGQSTYYLNYYSGVDVTVRNDAQYLAYGSSDRLPQLQDNDERGNFYAAATLFLLFTMCMFSLIDRIFRYVGVRR